MFQFVPTTGIYNLAVTIRIDCRLNQCLKKDKKQVYLIQQIKQEKEIQKTEELLANNQCHFDHVGLDTCVRKLILFIVIYSTDFQNVLKNK